MVICRENADGSVVRILARGNFSLGSDILVNFLLLLGAVTLGLSGLLAWLGYWPILLIAMIQLAIVSLILIRSWQHAWVREEIEVSEDEVRISHQRHKHLYQCTLESAWAVVEVIQPEVAWYGPSVRIRSGRESLELGVFLTGEEKLQLARHVQCAIEKHSVLRGTYNF